MARRFKLAINGRFLTQPLTGMQRFAGEILMALDSLIEGGSWNGLDTHIEVLVPKGPRRVLPLQNICIRECGFSRGYLWEQFELPIYAAGRTLLSPCAIGPLLYHHQFVVVHDATFMAIPETFSWFVRATYELIIPRLARNAAGRAAVSEFTRHEMARWFAIKPEDVIVCGEGSDHIDRTATDKTVLDRNNLRGKQFMLAVGLGGTNKNFDAILNSFAAADLGDMLLVVVGCHNPHVFGKVASVDTNFVRYTGRISDSELKALYENAVALVYPSLYEGFGLPPLEAMACGCPVIGTDQPALVEVASGCALHYSMRAPEDLVPLLKRVTTDNALRADLSRRGRERATQFQWRDAACILLQSCADLTQRRLTL